jgi:hypothetical protein
MRGWELFWTGWAAVTIGASWIAALVCIVGGAIDLHSLIKDLKAMPPEKETEHAMHGES